MEAIFRTYVHTDGQGDNFYMPPPPIANGGGIITPIKQRTPDEKLRFEQLPACELTLKAPNRTTAEKNCNIFPNLKKNNKE